MKFKTKKILTIALKRETIEFKDGEYNCTSTIIESQLKAHPRFGIDFFAEEETVAKKKPTIKE